MSKKITVAIDDSFCLQEIASDDRVYIKQEQQDEGLVWAIYSPDGERMGQAFSREMALAIICQNDLVVAQLH